MTDSHCHVPGAGVRNFVCLEPGERLVDSGGGRLFFGYHPWRVEAYNEAALRTALTEHPDAGVGEIGLDRLKERSISDRMRSVFRSQLMLAAEFKRPVVLHGAKCWGEVVKEFAPFAALVGACIFHGFSRSTGLVGDIAKLGGYISIGPAILNDHAVNYRKMASTLPEELLLVETDRTAENAADLPAVDSVAAELARVRGIANEDMVRILERNAERFLGAFRR